MNTTTTLTGTVRWITIDEGKKGKHDGAVLVTGCKGVKYYLLDPTDRSRTGSKQKVFKQFADKVCKVTGHLTDGSLFTVSTIATVDDSLSHSF